MCLIKYLHTRRFLCLSCSAAAATSPICPPLWPLPPPRPPLAPLLPAGRPLPLPLTAPRLTGLEVELVSLISTLLCCLDRSRLSGLGVALELIYNITSTK